MSGNKVDVKVVLLGKEYGGKTSLVERYLHNRFNDELPYQNTIGAAYGAKRVEISGHPVVMGIWDTAGSERYQAMSRIYYRGAWAAVVCYDLTEETSFAKAKFWVEELGTNEPNCRLYFCGTKRDLISEANPRQVEFQSAMSFAENYGAPVFETSSRTGENVAELFERIARDFLQELNLRKPLVNSHSDANRLTLESNLKTKKHNDCPC